MKQLQDNFATHGLVRPRQDRLFAGVCSGIGRRFGVDAWLVRTLFVIACIVLPGSQLIVYPILWVLMPEEPREAVRQTVTVDPQPAYPGYPQR